MWTRLTLDKTTMTVTTMAMLTAMPTTTKTGRQLNASMTRYVLSQDNDCGSVSKAKPYIRTTSMSTCLNRPMMPEPDQEAGGV